MLLTKQLTRILQKHLPNSDVTAKECDARGVAVCSKARPKIIFFILWYQSSEFHGIPVASHPCTLLLWATVYGFILKRTFNFFFFEGFYNVAYLKVVVVLNRKTALHS